MVDVKIGNRVETFDGTIQGTILEIQGEYCMKVKWDDGETGHVHPLDVNYVTPNQ